MKEHFIEIVKEKLINNCSIFCFLFGSATFRFNESNDIDLLLLVEDKQNTKELSQKIKEFRSIIKKDFGKQADIFLMTLQTFWTKIILGDVQLLTLLLDSYEISGKNITSIFKILISKQIIHSDKTQIVKLSHYILLLIKETKEGSNNITKKNYANFMSKIRTIYRSSIQTFLIANNIQLSVPREYFKYESLLKNAIGEKKYKNYILFERKMKNVAKNSGGFFDNDLEKWLQESILFFEAIKENISIENL